MKIKKTQKTNIKQKRKPLAEVFYNFNYVSVNYSVKNSIDCNFVQDFFLLIKTKTVQKMPILLIVQRTIWKLIKNKVNIYNQQLNF